MPTLDLDVVRAQFPAFRDPSLAEWAFFENAGGSFPCQQVIDRLTGYYTETKVQPHHPYPLAQRAGEAMDAGRRRLAACLGVHEDELQVGPSTTQNTYVLGHAFRSVLGPDDAIVVTDQDHEANTGAWRRLAEDGVAVRVWQVDPGSGLLDLDELDRLLDDDVALVAFPQASNVVGELNPVREICDRAHAVDAVAVVDGVAAAPHGLPHVETLGADIYLFSTYKTYGPHQGVMAVRRELLDRLPNQGHYFNADQLPKRLVPAGPDHAQVAALGGLVDYLEALDAHHFDEPAESPAAMTHRVAGLWRAHERRVMGPLLAFLGEREDVRVVGSTEPSDTRLPTVCIATEESGAGLAAALSEHGIMCGGGHFYAPRLLEGIGIDPSHGVTRFSFVHNTTEGEVAQLIAALERVL